MANALTTTVSTERKSFSMAKFFNSLFSLSEGQNSHNNNVARLEKNANRLRIASA
jgi:hypothetical protein